MSVASNLFKATLIGTLVAAASLGIVESAPLSEVTRPMLSKRPSGYVHWDMQAFMRRDVIDNLATADFTAAAAGSPQHHGHHSHTEPHQGHQGMQGTADPSRWDKTTVNPYFKPAVWDKTAKHRPNGGWDFADLVTADLTQVKSVAQASKISLMTT